MQSGLSNRSWDHYVLDFLGTARRVCIAIQEFRSRFDKWPDRLLIDAATLEAMREQLTAEGFERLAAVLAIDLQDSHTLAVAAVDGNFFDYNEPSDEANGNPISIEQVTTWLWGVTAPTRFE